MPRKTKTTAVADKAAQPQFSAELLEQLIPGPVTPAELEGIFQQFKKSVLERALGAEMSHHLGYAPGQARPEAAAANHRNGKSATTVLTDAGALRIDIPRDREGSFEPQLIGKHERRFSGFDDITSFVALCCLISNNAKTVMGRCWSPHTSITSTNCCLWCGIGCRMCELFSR